MILFYIIVAGGYYNVKVGSSLHIINLNTILWYNPDNKTAGIEDPSGQFAWLEVQLQEARMQAEKVTFGSYSFKSNRLTGQTTKVG